MSDMTYPTGFRGRGPTEELLENQSETVAMGGRLVAARPTPTPPPPDSEVVATPFSDRRRQAFTQTGDSIATVDEALEFLASAGVDTRELPVQFAAEDPAFREQLFSNPRAATQYALALALEFPAPVSDYDERLSKWGLDTLTFAPERSGLEQGIRQRPGLDPKEIRDALRAQPTPEFLTAETGAVKFRNGVVMNPETGEVYFPPNATVPGSPMWIRNAQESWSEERVRQEKRNLVEMGYLSPGSARKGTWDKGFITALREYHRSTYLNYGTPIASSEPVASSSGSTGSFGNLKKIEGQIRNSVRDQFRRVFGDDPSPAELQEWTQFVIRTGNQMQRGSRGLSPEAAAAEAGERFIERIEKSPQGQFERESLEENTQLHDAIVSAISATRGLY